MDPLRRSGFISSGEHKGAGFQPTWQGFSFCLSNYTFRHIESALEEIQGEVFAEEMLLFWFCRPI